jgi:ABC-2 type transport system permease protein
LAYAVKEWKILWRTPAYFMNCALSSILFPLFALIPLLSRQDSAEMLAGLSDRLQGEHAGGISLAFAFAAFVVLAGTNSTSVTAISREGQGFFLNKSLPIPYGQLIVAKLIPGTTLTAFSMALLVVEAAWFIKLSPLFVILALVVGIPGIIFINLLGIMVDLQMPKLSWSSEQEAVKQNLNPLFSMLFGIVTAGICILAAFSLDSSMIGMGLSLFILFALLDYVLYRILLKKGPLWMEKMDR